MKLFGKRGFTLIELLLVVAIIMVLASLVIVSVSKARTKSRDGKRVADLATIQLALEMYKDTYGNYGMALNSWFQTDNLIMPNFSSYLSPIPKDPINTGDYKYKAIGNNSGTPATGYWLGALFENKENIPDGFELGGAKSVAKCYQIWGGVATAGKSSTDAPPYCY